MRSIGSSILQGVELLSTVGSYYCSNSFKQLERIFEGRITEVDLYKG